MVPILNFGDPDCNEKGLTQTLARIALIFRFPSMRSNRAKRRHKLKEPGKLFFSDNNKKTQDLKTGLTSNEISLHARALS